MKKSIFILAMVCLLVGCTHMESLSNAESECLVSLRMVGDITSTEIPLTKSSANDIYFVQIYRGNNPFALGFFDDVEKMRFNLKKGVERYRIIVCLVKNGKVILGDDYNEQLNGVRITGLFSANGTVDLENTYSINVKSVEWGNGDNCKKNYRPLNELFYNSIGTFHLFRLEGTVYNEYNVNNAGSARLRFIGLAQILSGRNEVNCRYPLCDDWFYGEINDYSPNGTYETLPFELKRTGFKIKYQLTGVTDGEVRVRVFNSAKTFIDNTTSTSTYSSEPLFYAFYDTYSAWQYANDYMENFTLAVTWKRGYGENVVEDYGTKTIQIKRNCLNNIKINMGSNDQNASMNMTVESESTIGAAAVTIPVE